MLKKFLFAITFVLATSFSTLAQDPPENEVVAGYTYLRGDELKANLNGFNFSYTRYLNDNFGVTSEIGANFDSGINTFTYLIGPQIAANRGGRVSPFAHILVGGGRVSIEDFGSSNGFAVALGGGVDVKLNDKVSIRPIQIDYLPIRFNGGTIHNGRVGAGINFRF